MTNKEIFKLIKAKIATRDSWCMGFNAIDEDGNLVGAKAPEACRWCIQGACYAVCPDVEVYKETRNILCNFSYRMYKSGIVTVNDSINGFDLVHKLLDEAINESSY